MQFCSGARLLQLQGGVKSRVGGPPTCSDIQSVPQRRCTLSQSQGVRYWCIIDQKTLGFQQHDAYPNRIPSPAEGSAGAGAERRYKCLPVTLPEHLRDAIHTLILHERRVLAADNMTWSVRNSVSRSVCASRQIEQRAPHLDYTPARLLHLWPCSIAFKTAEIELITLSSSQLCADGAD